MKITKTAIVFAQNFVPNAKIKMDITKTFGALMQSKFLDKNVIKYASKSVQSGWQRTDDAEDSQFLSINNYDNGYGFIGDISRATVENSNELKFNDNNYLAEIAGFLKDYLIKEKTTINAVGINFHGILDVANPDDTLKKLLDKNATVVNRGDFFPANITLGYNMDIQSGKPENIAKIVVESKDNKCGFTANFNHDMNAISNSSECQVFLNKFLDFQNFLKEILTEIIEQK